ncbi:MAG: hypothetical protein RQ745_01810 [Longimicrobiales bacterium]|nr:hypothetical protein [Longimicrobiales bacterium]
MLSPGISVVAHRHPAWTRAPSAFHARWVPLFLFAVWGCAPAPQSASPEPSPTPSTPPTVGLLIMAHGGNEAWNHSVEAAVAEAARRMPTALAFGMADPHTLRAGVESLEAQGVERAVVVRLFLSGASFREQTEWLLGMSEVRPRHLMIMRHDPPAGDASHAPAEVEPIEHSLELVTHDHGLLDTRLAARIMTERATDLSRARAGESVLLLAHGMGDDAENAAVLANLERIAEAIRAAGFARVRAATLREDWPGKREAAQAEVRAFVDREAAASRTVLVLPARLSGFGPYAEVLEGLEYTPGDGLLPHPALADWIVRTGTRVACESGWLSSEACG